jgi:hypothetical protein
MLMREKVDAASAPRHATMMLTDIERAKNACPPRHGDALTSRIPDHHLPFSPQWS